MTQEHPDPTGGPARGAAGEDQEQTGPVIRDKRRIDPDTGQARTAPDAHAAAEQPQAEGPDVAAAQAADDPRGDAAGEPADEVTGAADDLHPDTLLAAERLEEMRRMQAEFVNFRNRTQRDREADRDRATSAVVEALLPVMDDIHSAREHGDLPDDSPFAAIAEKLEQILGRFGAERTGFVGEPFDPNVHEALMHMPADSPGVELPEDATEMTIVQVMQPGFKVGDYVVRAARVAVADPS